MRDLKWNLFLLLLLFVLSVTVVSLKPINLGLDLKGGISLVLQPDINYSLEQEYDRYVKDIEEKIRQGGLKVLEVVVIKEGIRVELLEEGDYPKLSELLAKEFPRFTVARREKEGVVLKLKEQEIEQFRVGVLTQTIEVLRKRIDELGVVQPVITRIGTDRILVELPGLLDLQRAKSLVGRTALLELKLVVESGPKEALQDKVTRDRELLPDRLGGEWFLVEKVPVVTGADLKTAYTASDEFGMPAVGFELTDRGSKVFAEATGQNIGRRLAIVLDKKVISAPVIRSRISDRGQISGNFTLEEAKELAIVLRAGALPTRVEFLQETVVGPSLGKDAIEQGIKAGVAGFLLLLMLLLARYKTAGLTATLSIILNALMLWAGLVLLGGTLTLPGIAGIILNMGIAVDSNVLIFERVKEELRLGNSQRKSIELGYRRTLSAVWDTHITLLVAALILFQFGSGPVKGFATTLTIGTIASFVSNVYFAKVLLELLSKLRLFRV
ncbi:MAG: protein translocase subunit SecD [Aquificaceae bacterium]|nr:protein translocase subunit SecD [Aquificaceae bacterium]MDW8294887.1 protein translocase subunit SecD [Aquificaceae bacterium]